jgi:hypothetical protein
MELWGVQEGWFPVTTFGGVACAVHHQIRAPS